MRCNFQNEHEQCRCSTSPTQHTCLHLPTNISSDCGNDSNSRGKPHYRCPYNECTCSCNNDTSNIGNWKCGKYDRYVRVRLINNHCHDKDDGGISGDTFSDSDTFSDNETFSDSLNEFDHLSN